MLAEIAVILIILMTLAFVYLKGSAIKAFVLLINTLIAAAIALAYFETLGRMAIDHKFMPQWAFGMVLLVIFALVLVILYTIGDKLTGFDLFIGDVPDKIVRCFIAIPAGLAIAGVILTAAAMLPVGAKWPYERFSKTPTSAKPEKTLVLNADGFITNMVSLMSRGSISGSKSLAVFHPRLLDEIYLNRIGLDKTTSAITESAITVDEAIAVQTPLLSKEDNQPINQDSQTKAVIIKAKLDGSSFTMSQARLICKTSDSAGHFTGSGQVFWSIGTMAGDNIVEMKKLSDKMKNRQIALVFYIPVDMVPVLLEYKQNGIAPVRKLITPQPASAE